MNGRSIEKIGQIGVPVKDLNRAISFYKERLGLPLLFHTETMAFFDVGGVRLLLSLPETEAFAHAGSVIYFQVEDIQATYQMMKEKGVSFIGAPHRIAKVGQTETWMAFFKDSEGNTHAYMSEVEV
jgi:methylmalonyl-CoA/ethylmalonyl-CoA epimerase